MTGFYGKTYLYKDKTIGVCTTLDPNTYMVGFQTTGGHKRLKTIPLSNSAKVTQARLDKFAKAKGLQEVKS